MSLNYSENHQKSQGFNRGKSIDELYKLARHPSRAHWEIFRQVSRGKSLEEAREMVLSLGDGLACGNGSRGDSVSLLAEIFPELSRGDVKRAIKYYARRSRRLNRRLVQFLKPRRAMRPTNRQRMAVRPVGYFRAPSRVTSHNHKEGGTRASNSDDPDGDGESEPEPACNLKTLPAPSWAQKSLSKIQSNRFFSPWWMLPLGQWCYVWGWAS